MDPVFWQWFLLVFSGVAFLVIAPFSKTKMEFFSALSKGKKPGFLILTSSLVISWIFAKSITNAADLGLKLGFVGGFGYAIYYLSFVVAGVVIYQLRVKGGFGSIHEFLQSRFGRAAVVVFSLLIGIRLFNEVWSNTLVIGSYFGEAGTTSYYSAIFVFTALTLAYTLKGGLRSSLLTDAIQMVFFGVLLFLLMSFILPGTDKGLGDYVASGDWTMATGLNFVFAALIQVFSYPFHDPVMTDRGFISDPKTTLKSYITAAAVGFVCLLVFSFVGIFARFEGMTDGGAAVKVSRMLGVGAMLAMNFIMVTSAASTLDSTFSSFSKLIVIDLGAKSFQTVSRGRIVMVIVTVVGTLPIFFNPAVLSATTVSGTMVMGLAPVFLLWRKKAPTLSFHLPVWFGIGVGILYAAGAIPKTLVLTEGAYAELLWANVWGLLGCFVLFTIPLFFGTWKEKK